MNKSNGFTLVETLLCLSTIIILSSFSMKTIYVDTVSLDSVVYQIMETIEQAKLYSVAYCQSVKITLNKNSISCQLENENISYQWDDSIDIQDTQTISFNQEGHINSATSVEICQGSDCSSIVFHLETGHMNVQ
ncbi:type II secretion system protein [Tannockella kyphosi]|uniref:type II secretion system protein n=1 Tax=Tannockella kyphosi TaxID=2899121 RepID=UPI00201275B7|nr:type II secretion system protein [Tannockella kyphosi]